MHVVVFEPYHRGHRFFYVRLIVKALRELDVRITLLTSPAAADSVAYQHHLAPLASCFDLDTSAASRGSSWLRYARECVPALQRVLQDLRPDHLYIPFGSGISQVVGLHRRLGLFRAPGATEVEALQFRGGFAYPGSGGWRGRLTGRAWPLLVGSAPWTLIHHLDPIVVDAIKRDYPVLAQRVRLMPDVVRPFPITTSAEARQRLGLDTGGRYLGCVGGMDRRKGIDRLIRAFATARLGDQDRLLLVGQQEQPIRDLLHHEAADLVRRGRIIVFDRYATDEELGLAIAAMDLVCTPYPRDRSHQGSSNIVIRAASQGRPVLASDFGWVGWAVERFGLGWTCDAIDTEALTRAIVARLDETATFRTTDAGRRFAAFHHPENFMACWTDRLRGRMGLAPAPGRQDWTEVLSAERQRVPRA